MNKKVIILFAFLACNCCAFGQDYVMSSSFFDTRNNFNQFINERIEVSGESNLIRLEDSLVEKKIILLKSVQNEFDLISALEISKVSLLSSNYVFEDFENIDIFNEINEKYRLELKNNSFYIQAGDKAIENSKNKITNLSPVELYFLNYFNEELFSKNIKKLKLKEYKKIVNKLNSTNILCFKDLSEEVTEIYPKK